MTKQTYNSMVTHTDDATFRAWGLQLSNALQACGLVKTADTGQVNWASVTRPGTGIAGGYEIYRFNDALQATAPVFLKLEYGTAASSATNPTLWITVGVGSNGAGTISTPNTGRLLAMRGFVLSQAGNTYITHTGGALVLAWSIGSSPAGGAGALIVIDRARDDTGAALAEGVYVLYTGDAAGNNYPASICLSFTTSTTYALAASSRCANCMVPAGLGASIVGTDTQLFRHYVVTPRVRGSIAVLTYIGTEIGAGTTITAIPVGSTTRTYMPLGSPGPQGVAFPSLLGNDSRYVAAVLWED